MIPVFHDLRTLCHECDCKAERHCDGCDAELCLADWYEHNEDAPCHEDDPDSYAAWLEKHEGDGDEAAY